MAPFFRTPPHRCCNPGCIEKTRLQRWSQHRGSSLSLSWQPLLRNGRDYLLRQVAGTLRRVEDLVVEDREVESETQPDGVGRSQVHQGDVLYTLTQGVSCDKIQYRAPSLSDVHADSTLMYICCMTRCCAPKKCGFTKATIFGRTRELCGTCAALYASRVCSAASLRSVPLLNSAR